MAMAATIRSLMTKSQLWLLFSISLAALTLLIKPSGLMVMALLAWTWFVTVACQWRCASRCLSPDRLLLAYALKGTVVFLIFYGSVIAVCVFSEYLSEQNFAFAKKVLVTMDEACRISLHDSYRLLHSSSGEVLLIWIIGVASMFTYGTIFGKKPMTQLQATVVACLLSSIIIWILGTWYWLIVQAGGYEIRYFYPFMLMGSICVVPAALFIYEQTHNIIRQGFLVLCLIPAFNIAGLLMAGDNPSIYWQKLTGVNVSVGVYQESVRQAYTFLKETRKIGKNATVYTFADGVSSITFENILLMEEMIKPRQLNIKVVNPLDWVCHSSQRDSRQRLHSCHET